MEFNKTSNMKVFLRAVFFMLVVFFIFPGILKAAEYNKPYEHKEISEAEMYRNKSAVKKNTQSESLEVLNEVKPVEPLQQKMPVRESIKNSSDDIKTKNSNKNNQGKESDKFSELSLHELIQHYSYEDPIFSEVQVDFSTGRVIWFSPEEKSKIFTADSSAPLELQPYEKLTRNRSVSISLDRSPLVRGAEEKINQAAAQYRQAKTAKNPVLQFDGLTELQGPSSSISLEPLLPETIIFSRDYNIVGQLSLQHLITTFGAVEKQIAAAFINIRAYQEKMETEKNNVRLEAKKAFNNILKAESMIKAAVDYLDLSAEYLKNANSLYKHGMVSRYDVVRSELSVSEAAQSLISAKKNFMLAKSVFLLVLNYDEPVPFSPVHDKQRLLSSDLTLDKLYQQGLTSRHEISEMEENIAASKELLEAAKRENNPKVFLSGKYIRMTGTSVSNDYTWNVGLAVSIPILDGGVKKTKIDESQSVINYAQIALDSLKKQIKLEIQQAFLNLKEAEVMIKSALMDVKKSEEGYRMAKVRYENGLSTAVEMDDSLKTLNRSKINLINTLYDYNSALAELEKSIGRDFLTQELEIFEGVDGIDEK